MILQLGGHGKLTVYCSWDVIEVAAVLRGVHASAVTERMAMDLVMRVERFISRVNLSTRRLEIVREWDREESTFEVVATYEPVTGLGYRELMEPMKAFLETVAERSLVNGAVG